MTTVIAAIDSTPAARPVLETALSLAGLLGADVEGVHVPDAGTETVHLTAARLHVPVRIVEGPPADAIIAALEPPDVVGAVVGARATPGGRRPVGGTALAVLERSEKPLAVVPPEAAAVGVNPVRRVLVPLDATRESGAALARLEAAAAGRIGAVDVVLLHVFGPDTMPRFLDRPERDLLMWADEFRDRWSRLPGVRVETRMGEPSGGILAATREESPDLVVLSWRRNLDEGHAQVVRDVLAHCAVPVLLLPVREDEVIDVRRAPAGAPLSR
jgi:nucleotide-binding universal stress UspA family protein